MNEVDDKLDSLARTIRQLMTLRSRSEEKIELLQYQVDQLIRDIKLLNSKVEDMIGVLPHPSTHYILDENGFILEDEGGIRLTGGR